MWAVGLARATGARAPVGRAVLAVQVRGVRGKPPSIARNLQQRLEEMRAAEPEGAPPTDIGLPFERPSRGKLLSKRLARYRELRNDPRLEKMARDREIAIDLRDVEAEWFENSGPHHVRRVAEHYGIFRDLYEEGYFTPVVRLKVAFETDEVVSPVFYGNSIKPAEAKRVPTVDFDSEPGELWTLTLTCPDGHFEDARREHLHWCVANIPGNDVGRGETLVEYMRPIPPKGTGHHRYVFVLYKQEKRCDFNIRKVVDGGAASDRTFSTREWYAEHQDVVTPAGLAFFQSDWDPSLTEFYHEVLKMKEPVYEYDFPTPHRKRQKWFPKKMAFDKYMDRYRDPKDVNRDLFLPILKEERPFEKPKPPFAYPNAIRVDNMKYPSWHVDRDIKRKLKQGAINDVLL